MSPALYRPAISDRLQLRILIPAAAGFSAQNPHIAHTTLPSCCSSHIFISPLDLPEFFLLHNLHIPQELITPSPSSAGIDLVHASKAAFLTLRHNYDVSSTVKGFASGHTHSPKAQSTAALRDRCADAHLRASLPDTDLTRGPGPSACSPHHGVTCTVEGTCGAH